MTPKRGNQSVKTPTEIINKTLATLESQPTQGAVKESPKPSSGVHLPKVAHPCRTQWQRKWMGLDVVTPMIQALADEAEAFAGRWYRNNPTRALLVLAGEPGVGKSHVAKKLNQFARAAAHSSFETGAWGLDAVPGSLELNWPEVVDGFKEGHYWIVDDCLTVELLTIDDLGAENDPSKNAADKLCQILSRREQLFTIITTNIAPVNWEERFDARIADRLLRNSALVDLFNVPSYSLNYERKTNLRRKTQRPSLAAPQTDSDGARKLEMRVL